MGFLLNRCLATGLALLGMLASGMTLVAEEKPSAKQFVDTFQQRIEEHQPLRIFIRARATIPYEHCFVQAISDDGKYLVADAYENQKSKTICWDVDKDQLLWELDSGTVSACAYSGDGKHLLVGKLGGSIDVLDAANGDKLFTHDTLDSGICGVGFAADERFIYAVDSQGNSFVAPLMEKATDIHQVGVSLGSNSVQMAAIDDNRWWKVIQQGRKFKHLIHDGDAPPQKFETPGSNPEFGTSEGDLAAGPEGMAWAERGTLVTARIDPDQPDRLLPHQEFEISDHAPIERVTISPEKSYAWVWQSTHLDVFDMASGQEVNSIRLPTVGHQMGKPILHGSGLAMMCELNELQKSVHPAVWQLEGDEISALELTHQTIVQWLTDNRFDAIEELAARWDGRTDIFYTKVKQAPNRQIVNWIKEFDEPHKADETRDKLYELWVKKNPDQAQIMRMVVYELKHDATFDKFEIKEVMQEVKEIQDRSWWSYFFPSEKQRSRTDEILKTNQFRQDAWNELMEPIFQQEHIPAEAYWTFIHATIGNKKLKSQVDAKMEKALRRWPEYYPVFAYEAQHRVVSRNKLPDSTVNGFTKKIADQAGGVKGDVLYARMFQRTDINRYFTSTQPESVPADRARALRGMVTIAEQTEDVDAMSFGMELASRLNDEATARKIARRMLSVGAYPARSYDADANGQMIWRVVHEEERRKLSEQD
ncbi:WD40 repeat domain-containing protein [Bremerella sp. T1]|uniref:WD40 repeat domain-containing protein n=1 Tax=Bremerella sp. TYQ1 TaxID=3119568 RepID=UPI001CCEEA38|nr:hypothetical protein [Bremerella volcania]UBM36528.1 hypothetical protein LA756_01185 [Bremerella volcania]